LGVGDWNLEFRGRESGLGEDERWTPAIPLIFFCLKRVLGENGVNYHAKPALVLSFRCSISRG